MDTLPTAYKKLFGKDPEPQTPQWELARDIIDHWNVPKLGEELAQECIFRIVTHVVYPTNEITEQVVKIAEDKATELFPELAEMDASMDNIAALETKYHERKTENSEPKIR